MKSFEHILVPFNGTPASHKAFRKAVSIAEESGADITILTCIEERPTFGFFKTKTTKAEFEKEKKLVEKQQAELDSYAAKKSINCKLKIFKHSMASQVILSYVKQHDVDLVMMGKNKITTIAERSVYHSTIENVFRNIRCSLLIIQ
ncbi:MAG: universal stress protein [Nitrosopumilaceae archaeon]